jgi:hypothetical protein
MVSRAHLSQSDIDALLECELWEYAAECHADPTIVNDAKLYGVDIVRLYRDYAKFDWIAIAHVFKLSRERALQVLMDYAIAGETIRDHQLWKQLFDPDRQPEPQLAGWFVLQWRWRSRLGLRGRTSQLSSKQATRFLRKKHLARSDEEAIYLLERLITVGKFQYRKFFAGTQTAELRRAVENGQTYYWLVQYTSPGIQSGVPAKQ